MRSTGRSGIVGILVGIGLLAGACSTQRRNVAVNSATPLAKKLDEALHRGKTGPAHYGARVMDLSSGRELYRVDADVPLMPASNGKLAVGAATLDFFGSQHVFRTWLALDGDDLWIVGSGDPGVGDNTIAKKYGGTTMTILDRWADALAARGVKTIKGNLYYYDRVFDEQWTHPSWSKSYITDWYAAPISGLNFNNNCIDVSVKPTRDGEPVTYSVIPPTKGVVIKNECVTGKGKEPDVEREMARNVFTIKGATTHPTTLKDEAEVDTRPVFADALRTRLEKRGIAIAGKTIRADKPLDGNLEPPKGKLVAVHETKMPDALSR